jgi:DNA-binding GntR family transcriptional regulator
MGNRNNASAPNQVEQVYARLRDLIVRGHLAPGSRLIEEDLCSRLDVSRTPVRSALLKLQQEQYVATDGRGGRQSRLSVAPLTAEDAYELWWLVGAVEGLAGRWAAILEDDARKILIAELKETNEELRELSRAAQRNPNRIFDLDSRFHRSFVEASVGPRVLAFHDSIKPQTERYWRLYTSSIVDELDVSVREHEKIIDAIERGDPEAAQATVEFNWRRGGDRLVQAIETLGARGTW